jgi:hypothetical protein
MHEGHLLNGCDHILIAQHNKVLNQSFSGIGRECTIILEKKGRQMGGEVLRFFGVTLRDLRCRRMSIEQLDYIRRCQRT